MKNPVRRLGVVPSVCEGPTNLILIGFMGAGKSSVGRYCAGVLGYKFRDTDKYIEIHSGMRISEIFATAGESDFRERERRAVSALVRYRGLVIATGGGVVINPANVQDLRQNGVVIWLRTPPEEVFRRTEGRTHRPLLEGIEDKRGHIRALMASRDELYRDASHVIIDSMGENIESIGEQVLNQFRAVVESRKLADFKED